MIENENNTTHLNKKPLRARRQTSPKKTTSELVIIFWNAPPEAFFGQETVGGVVSKSLKTLEMERWLKKGIPYRKVGGRVLYQKQDVISWIESHELISPV